MQEEKEYGFPGGKERRMSWLEVRETDETYLLLNVDRISTIGQDEEGSVVWLDNGMRLKIDAPFFALREEIRRIAERKDS